MLQSFHDRHPQTDSKYCNIDYLVLLEVPSINIQFNSIQFSLVQMLFNVVFVYKFFIL